jgi:SAM-dependent methyltransferase
MTEQLSEVAQEYERDEARAVLWEMITGYRISQIVRVAAALSLAEHCATGPVSAEQVASLESADSTATARFLRMCAAIGLVKCVDGPSFAATPLLAALSRTAPGSLRGFALSLPAAGHWLPWGRLLEAVKTGEHQAPDALGRDLFAYYATEPAEAEAFTEGLLGMTSVAGAEAARVIDTTGTGLAVDVGGASGDLLHDLLRVNPALTGVVFDLPHVAPGALAAAAREGLSDRLRVATGDFFESVPAGGDLYLLRYVLHDWDDEKCVQILRNCRRAMRPGGRVVVLEMILGDIGREPSVVPSQDLNMLVLLGGRERTVEQFDELFRAAGLRRTAVTGTESPMSVIEAVAARD